MIAVKVYWPQDMTAASHWEFATQEDLLAWLHGVLLGPACRVIIERSWALPANAPADAYCRES